MKDIKSDFLQFHPAAYQWRLDEPLNLVDTFMNTLPLIRRRRRQHAPEFKQELVALFQPDISTSAVALENGVSANLLRRWIKQFSGGLPSKAITAPMKLVPNCQAERPISGGVSENGKIVR